MGRKTAEEQRDKRLLKRKNKEMEEKSGQVTKAPEVPAPPKVKSNDKPKSGKRKETKENVEESVLTPTSSKSTNQKASKRKREEETVINIGEENKGAQPPSKKKKNAEKSGKIEKQHDKTTQESKDKDLSNSTKKRNSLKDGDGETPDPKSKKTKNQKKENTEKKSKSKSSEKTNASPGSKSKGGGNSGEPDKSKGGKNDEKKVRPKKVKLGPMKYTVFFGQLPFNTTREMLVEELTKLDVSAEKIRMMTDKNTKLFRGIAFADFPTAAERRKVVKSLHHSDFHGRKINVEDVDFKRDEQHSKPKNTESGKPSKAAGSKGEKKSKFSKKLSDPEVETLIRNQIAESKGALKREDFDDKNVSFLSLLHKAVAEKALKEASKRAKNTKVRNRQAYFMGVILRVAKNEEAKAAKSSKEMAANDS